MMKFCFTLILLNLFTACNSQIDKCELNYINHVDKLLLIQEDDNCGEWGGNKTEILIYRKSFNGQLFAEVTTQHKLCEPVPTYLETKVVGEFQLTTEQTCLVLESVEQLSSGILERKNFPSHSGYYNQVTLSDSSILLTDFPSIKWTNFDKLYKSLTN